MTRDPRATYYLGTDPISEAEYESLRARTDARLAGKPRPVPVYLPPVIHEVPQRPKAVLVPTKRGEAVLVVGAAAAAIVVAWVAIIALWAIFS